jgi:hypothetical protein
MVGVANLLDEARQAGLKVRLDGDRLVIQGPKRAEPIARRLIENKPVVVEMLRTSAPHSAHGDYADLARSPLVARVRAAWPWIAEHRPDLFRRICDADYADDVTALHAGMVEASKAYEERQRGELARIYSRVLGAELWIAPDEEAADELRRDGVTLPVLLPSEAMVLGGMAEADAGELFAALARVQRVMPGSRLRSVTPHTGEILDA